MHTAESYRLEVDGAALLTDPFLRATVAGRVFPEVFRTELTRPGFFLLDLGRDLTPAAFREALLALIGEWQALYRAAFGRPLRLRLLGRFDQKLTTAPHRDGGPPESILVLGYEPTEVRSRLRLIDYTLQAQDRGITPEQLLDQGTLEGADAYATEVMDFDCPTYRIVVVNNSVNAPGTPGRTLGLLHEAVMETPAADAPRWVNSIQMAALDEEAPEQGPLSLDPFRLRGEPVAL